MPSERLPVRATAEPAAHPSVSRFLLQANAVGRRHSELRTPYLRRGLCSLLMAAAWREYQEQVAAFFRDLGLTAETDATVTGTRTHHDVDVLVEASVRGVPIRWIVECKHWQRRVSKLTVMGLRTIVTDTGADRGFVMNEKGYQKGALEAATSTNVQLTSLADLRETCKYDLAMAAVEQLCRRARLCRWRYWELDKDVRIAHGLRGDFDPTAYSGDRTVRAIEASGLAAIFHGFPVVYDELLSAMPSHLGLPNEKSPASIVVDAPEPLVELLGRKVVELEALLDTAEASVRKV